MFEEELLYNRLYQYVANISEEDLKIFRMQIETHKYYLNEDYNKEISFDSACNSFNEYIFEPFIYEIEKRNLLKYSDLNFLELFNKIINDWDEMKKTVLKSDKNIHIYHAIDRYCLSLKNYPFLRKIKLYFK